LARRCFFFARALASSLPSITLYFNTQAVLFPWPIVRGVSSQPDCVETRQNFFLKILRSAVRVNYSFHIPNHKNGTITDFQITRLRKIIRSAIIYHFYKSFWRKIQIRGRGRPRDVARSSCFAIWCDDYTNECKIPSYLCI